jgi:hypothetical protein
MDSLCFCAGAALGQYRQAQARFDGEIQRRHLFQRGMQLRIAAGLQSDHEGKRRLLVSRLLQYGIDVQSVRRENGGQLRDDSGLVLDQKAQIPRGLKIAAHFGYEKLLRPVRPRAGKQALRFEHEVGNDSHRRRISTCTRAQKRHVAPILPEVNTRF